MGSNCCKGDASRPIRSTSSIYTRSRAGASLDDRFTTSDDAGGVRLTVSAAQTGDSGVYTLQASNAAGSDTSKIRLEVSAEETPTGEDPPTFLRRLQDLTVKVGSRTRFLVEIISSTECKVTWYRNERRLLEAERVALARDGNFWCADVAAVSVDDAGRWTCTAENAGGRASCSAHLNVLVPKAYKRPEFVEELRALLTEQGTVSLECKVVGVPTPVLRWFKDSREIKAGDVFALTANAEDPTSLGTYTCEAVNCMGRAYSSSKVHVVGRASREGSARPSSGGMTPEPPPIFTKELEDAHVKICEHLTLGCHVVVPPWPRSVVWYNKEGKVEPGERYHTLEDGVGGYLLEIPSVEWADEGEWKCVATSAGGRVGITTCYVAMDVPKNYRKPRFMENLQAVLTEEGLVSFECKVVGFPTPVLSWFKDGQELKPGDVYQLTGTNSLGSYCCIAKNCMGQASSSAELTVEDIQNQLNEEEKLQLFSKNQAPKFLQGLKSVEAKIDEPFRFTVKVAIPPEPSVLWYRDDQPVDESTRCHLEKEEKGIFNLDIQKLEFLDQAEWKCVAMNDFGHSVTSCFLKLIIPKHYKKPRFLENLQAILSDEGAVNLECKVIGVPQPVLKWYKDGEELKPGDIHRIISGQDGTCCLGTYTCEAQNCMGIAASSASLLGFDDSMKSKPKAKEEQPLQRNLSLSTIHEERTSQMYDTPVGDITLDDKGEISFSFDGKEVSVSLYETPDLTEEEALQIVEMYADQLSENVTEHNVVELPPLRFVKETSTSGNLLMEAIIIDVSPDYFATPEEDLRTEADVEDLSIADENGLPQLSLDQEIDIGGEDYLEKTMALMSEDRSDFAAKSSRRKSDSQRSADDFFSLSRDQSLSEEKRDDDTHVSESELQSFASARSSAKVKSKSSKRSGEEGQESSEPTKTMLLKDEIASKSSKNELTKQQDPQLDVPVIKPKRERRTSRSSRRSSTSSEKSVGKSREDLLRLKSDIEQTPSKPSMSDEDFKTSMNSISTSLTKVINDVQLIERDIILKSELMSSAATASRSLEIISSLINPLSEIHSIAEAAKESVSESREVTSTIFNSVQQPLKTLQQSLTILEKCIDMESDNKTLVKKTCVAFIETCGMEVQNILADITSVTAKDYIKIEEKVVNEIDSVVTEMTTVIKFSAETIKTRNILSEARDIKPDTPTLETKHLKDTQKAIFELKSPLNSLLRIVDSAQSGNIIDLSKVRHSEVIMNDMSASIQDLQTALEQIESLSVKETFSTLHKHNTDIIETVMDSVIKLRGSFELLSTDPNTEQDKTLLDDTLMALKENIIEISNKIETIDNVVGKFDILQSENKLDVLQKMAQILIALENNLPRLEAMPTVKSHMDVFHKNLTKVLEKIIESNDAEKYQMMMEICDTVSIMNSSIRNIDSVNTEDVLPLASLINTLKIIETHLINNIIESELNCRILNNISDVLVDIQEVINKAEDSSIQIDSEYIQDISSQIMNEEKVNIIIEHIDQTIAAINTVKTIESAQELKSTLTPAFEYVCPILEELRKCVASVRSGGVEQDEHISEIPDASFAQTIATPLCELNQSIIVLNQLIAENIDYIKENTDIITAIAEPLHELHTTLEILQQDVVSQYREDLTPYEVSINMASVVQNLQSCILMIHEQGGVEGVEDMSTLEDISGIKTSADTLPSDRLVLPTAEETAIEQSYLPLNQAVATTATANTLQSLNEHIMVLQTPDIIEALDTLSELSDYASLKSVIVNLSDLHTGIEGILHPMPIEGSMDLDDTTNITKLAAIAEPMHEIHQSLSVLDTSNIPVYENIIDLPSDKIHSVFQSISELKNSLEQCMCAVLPAMEIANTTIEISNKVSTLREVCEQLKEIFDTSKDTPNEIAMPKEVQSLETVVNNLIDATDVSKDIRIDQVKSLTEELYLKVRDVQEDIIQFTAQSPEKISQEAKMIQIVDELETNIAVLEQYDFIDISLASDFTSCMSPQLAVEIDSESLAQLNDIAGNAVNVLQDANQEIPIADLLIVEDFFKTCKNEFTILRCLITKATSHKKIIRLLQEFKSLQSLINNFTTKRFEFRLSDDVNECLSNFLIHADDCLINAQNALIKVVEAQTDMLIKVPITQLEATRELKGMEYKSSEISSVIETLLQLADIAKHLENTLHSEVIEEISNPNQITKPKQEDTMLAEKMEELVMFVHAHIENQNINCLTVKIFEELMKCINKHNYKDALGTGKTLIILKCLAQCATIVQEEVTKKKMFVKEASEIKENENTLKDVLAEMLQPLQALQAELVNIQEQVLSGAEEDSISIDITTTESIMQTMTELHKDILHQIETDHSTLHSEDIPLLQEVDKEIHTICDSIRTMDNAQAVQAVKEITKPMEDIEKALQTVLTTECIEKESHPKEVSAQLIDHIDQYIELVEIIEEISAVIKLDNAKETFEIARELKETMSLNDSIENKELDINVCAEQTRLAKKLQAAISVLQVQVLDSAHKLAPSNDALERIAQVTAQLQANLEAVTSLQTSLQASALPSDTTIIATANDQSISSTTLESVQLDKTEFKSTQQVKAEGIEIADKISPEFMKVEEEKLLEHQSSVNISSSVSSQELNNIESIKTFDAESNNTPEASDAMVEVSSGKSSEKETVAIETAMIVKEDDCHKEKIFVEKSTAEDNLMQHIIEYVSEDIIEVVDTLSTVTDVGELKKSITIANELRECFAATEIDTTLESVGKLKNTHDQQMQLMQSLEIALSTLSEQTIEKLQELMPFDSKDNIEKIAVLIENLKTDLESVKISQPELHQLSPIGQKGPMKEEETSRLLQKVTEMQAITEDDIIIEAVSIPETDIVSIAESIEVKQKSATVAQDSLTKQYERDRQDTEAEIQVLHDETKGAISLGDDKNDVELSDQTITSQNIDISPQVYIEESTTNEILIQDEKSVRTANIITAAANDVKDAVIVSEVPKQEMAPDIANYEKATANDELTELSKADIKEVEVTGATATTSASGLVAPQLEQQITETFNTSAAKETLIQNINLFLSENVLHLICKQHINVEEFDKAVEIARELNQFLITSQIKRPSESVTIERHDINHTKLIIQLRQVLSSIQVQLLGKDSVESPSLYNDVQCAANVISKLTDELTSVLSAVMLVSEEDLVSSNQGESKIPHDEILTEASDEFVDCSSEDGGFLKQKNSIEVNVPKTIETTQPFEEFFDSPTLADELPLAELLGTEVRELTVFESTKSIENSSKSIETTESAKINISDSLTTAVTVTTMENNDLVTSSSDLEMLLLEGSLSQINFGKDLSSQGLVAQGNMIENNERESGLEKMTENIHSKFKNTNPECLPLECLESTAVIVTEDESFEELSRLDDNLGTFTEMLSSTKLEEIQEDLMKVATDYIPSSPGESSTNQVTEERNYKYLRDASLPINSETEKPLHELTHSDRALKELAVGASENDNIQEKATQPKDAEMDLTLELALTDIDFPKCVKETSLQNDVQNIVSDEIPSNYVELTSIEETVSKETNFINEVIPIEDKENNIEKPTPTDDLLPVKPIINECDVLKIKEDLINASTNETPTVGTSSFAITNEVKINEVTKIRKEECFSDVVAEIPSITDVEDSTSMQENALQENVVLMQNLETVLLQQTCAVDNMISSISAQRGVIEPSPVHMESLYTRLEDYITSEDVSKVADKLSSTSTGLHLKMSLQSAKQLIEIMSMPQSLVERQKPVIELRDALCKTLSEISDTASEFGLLQNENVEKVIRVSTLLLAEINDVIFTSNEVLQDIMKEANELFFNISDQDIISENLKTDIIILSDMQEEYSEASSTELPKDTTAAINDISAQRMQVEEITKFLERNPNDNKVEDSNQHLLNRDEPNRDLDVQPAIPVSEQINQHINEMIKQTSNDLEDQTANISKHLVISDKDQTPITNAVQNIEEHRNLIEHIDAFITDEVVEVVDEISNITNLETLKESISIAKKLRESLVAIDYSVTAEEATPINEKIILKQAKLAQSLQDALSTWQFQALDNTEVVTPLLSSEALQRVSEIISHLQDDLGTAIVFDVAENLKLGEIDNALVCEEQNGISQLETLLQDVNMKINPADRSTDADDSESLRDTLDEVQTVIIKLKSEYDGAINDTLNETLEDLECSVRSVQLQINEESPPELLNEACATLQLLVENMNAAKQVQATQTSQISETTEIILDKCSNETEKSVKLLDLAAKLDTKKSDNLTGIVNNIKTIRDQLKTLRASFLVDADTVIENGVKVVEYLNQIEENIFSLEREVEMAENITTDTRDTIISAVHSVYGSISNMRGTVSSVQKRFMFENFGKPSESLLHSMKNISIISSTDEDSNKASWKKLSKSLRKVLNHFEDIKFYINLDKTARLPSDAAFTKIILEELKDNIFSVLVPRAMLLDSTVLQKVNNTLKSVEINLSSIESESTLQVKNKIPMFKNIASEMLSTTTYMKNHLEALTVKAEINDQETEIVDIEKQHEESESTILEDKQTQLPFKSSQVTVSEEDVTKDKKEVTVMEPGIEIQSCSLDELKSKDSIQTTPITFETSDSSKIPVPEEDQKLDIYKAEGSKPLEKPAVNVDTVKISRTIKIDENQNLEDLVTTVDNNDQKIQVQCITEAEQVVEEQIEESSKQPSEECKDTTQLARTENIDDAASSSSRFVTLKDDDKQKEKQKSHASLSEYKEETPEDKETGLVLMREEELHTEREEREERKDKTDSHIKSKEKEACSFTKQEDAELEQRDDEKSLKKYENVKEVDDNLQTAKHDSEIEKLKTPAKETGTVNIEQKQNEIKSAEQENKDTEKTKHDELVEQNEERVRIVNEKDFDAQQKDETETSVRIEKSEKDSDKEDKPVKTKHDIAMTQKDEKTRSLKDKLDVEQEHEKEAEVRSMKEKENADLKQTDEETRAKKEIDVMEDIKPETIYAKQAEQGTELKHKMEEEACVLKEKSDSDLHHKKEIETHALKEKESTNFEQTSDEVLALQEKAIVLKKSEKEARAHKEKDKAVKVKQEKDDVEKVEQVEACAADAYPNNEKNRAEEAKREKEIEKSEHAAHFKYKEEESHAPKEKEGTKLVQKEEKELTEKVKEERDLSEMAEQDSEPKQTKEEETCVLEKHEDVELQQKDEEARITTDKKDVGKTKIEANSKQKEDRALKDKADSGLKLKEENAQVLNEKTDAELKQKEEEAQVLKEKAEVKKLKQERDAAEKARQDYELKQKEEEEVRADAELKQRENESRALKEIADAALKQNEEARILKEKAIAENLKEERDAIEKGMQDAELKQKAEEEARALKEKADAELKQKEAEAHILEDRAEAEKLKQEIDVPEKAKQDDELKLKEEVVRALKEKADGELKQNEEESRALKEKADAELKQMKEARILEEKAEAEKLKHERDASEKAKQDAELKQKEEEKALKEKADAELKQKEEEARILMEKAEAEKLKKERDASEKAKQDAELKQKEEEKVLKEIADAELKQKEEEARVLKENAEAEKLKQERDAVEKATQDSELKQKEEEKALKEKADAELKQKEEEARILMDKAEAKKLKQERDASEKAKQDAELKQKEEEKVLKEIADAELKQKEEEARVLKEKAEAEKLKQERDAVEKATQDSELKQKEEEKALKEKADAELKQKEEEARILMDKVEAKKLKQERDASEKAKQDAELKQKEEEKTLKEKADAELKQKEEEARILKEIAEAEKLKQERDASEKAKLDAELKQKEEEKTLKEKADAELKQKEEEARILKEKAEAEKLKQEREAAKKAKQDAELKQKEEEKTLKEKADAELKQKEEEARILKEKAEAEKLKQEREAAKKAKQDAELKQKEEEKTLKEKADAELKQKEEEARILKEKAEAEKLKQEREAAKKAKQDAELKLKEEEVRALKEKEDSDLKQKEADARIKKERAIIEKAEKSKKEADIKQMEEDARALKEKVDAELVQKEAEALALKEQAEAELRQKEEETLILQKKVEAEKLKQERDAVEKASQDAELKQKEEEEVRAIKEKEDAHLKQKEAEARIKKEKDTIEKAEKAKKEADFKQMEEEARALKEKVDVELVQKEAEARALKEQAEAELKLKEEQTLILQKKVEADKLKQERDAVEKATQDAEMKQKEAEALIKKEKAKKAKIEETEKAKKEADIKQREEARALKEKADAELAQKEEKVRAQKEAEDAELKQKEEDARVLKEKAHAELKQTDEARMLKEKADELLRQKQEEARVLKDKVDADLKQMAEEARVLKEKEDSNIQQKEEEARKKKEKAKKAKTEKAEKVKKEADVKRKEDDARALKEKADSELKQKEEEARAQKEKEEAEKVKEERDVTEKSKHDPELKHEEKEARALQEKEDVDIRFKKEKSKKAKIGKSENVNKNDELIQKDKVSSTCDENTKNFIKENEQTEQKLSQVQEACIQSRVTVKELEAVDDKIKDKRAGKDKQVQKIEYTQAENKEITSNDAKEITSRKISKYTERLGKSERRDDELHIYKEDIQTKNKKENGEITSKVFREESDEQHYIKEYQYQPSRTGPKLEVKEKSKFVDHNHRDYTMEFARPSGYREKSFDVDKSDSLTSHDYLGRNAAIYRAQTLVLDSQIRSSTPLLLDPNTSRTSEPSERWSEVRHRSKAHSEARTVTSEKRTSASRDSRRKPVFSTYLTDRTAVEGSRVKLTCSVLSSSDPTVTWYKNGVLLDNKLKYRTKFIDGLITLEVLNAVPSDSAEYSCTIQNENGSINSSANLKVYPSFEASPIPPTFTRSIRDTYHLAENELVLECRIRGQPLPTITWLKDNKSISNNSRYQAYYLADGVCRLAIEHPTPEDSGKYTCKAENSVWSDQITHVVNFTGKESRQGPNIATIEKSRFNRQAMESRRPHFTNVLSDYKVVTGGTIGLQVEIRGAPTRVEWLREGCSVTEVYRNAKTFVEQGLYTLALSDVTEKESGMYTCRAWSSQCHVDMNAAITVVQPNELDGKPAIIVGRPEKDILISIGEDVNISFRVQGEPKPKVVFMKGIRDITTSQRVCKMTSDDYVKFTLKRSVVSDAGTYCILARNAYGVDRAFVTVVVRQRASSDNLISDWTYPVDDSSHSIAERKYKSVPERIPGEPCVLEGGNNWISLGWPKSEPGQSAPVLAYKVESWLLGKDGGARWSELGITPLNSFDAFNLKQGEEYHFRVTPRNRYGWGESVQTASPISVGLAGDRPEFAVSLPGQLKVLVGETANLSCSVKGTPAPEVVWMKNGHEIEDEDRRISNTFNGFNCSLTIKDINIEDEARYSCEATNLHGRASTYARLAVVTDRSIWEADAKLKRERSADVDGDYPPQFTMRLRDRRVQATYPVRLTCQVIGSPDPRITWFKDGFEIKPDNRRSHFQDEHFHTLEIAPTNLEDGGVYEAMARNSSGAVSCRCNLVVDKGIRAYVAPEFCCGLEPLYRLTDGEELRISAVVEAYPSVGVTWYRDGVRLRPSRRAIMTLDRDGQIELALAAVTSRDAGVYSCTASNEVGRASTSGKVEVIGSNVNRTPPVFISPDEPYSKEPMFIRKPRSSEAREGDTVIIACEVVGDPKPDVYWLRDFLKPDYYRDSSHFKRMGDGPEYRFEIPHAKLDYTGAYSVVARNLHGEAKAIISLQILAKDPASSDDAHNIRYGRVEVLPRFSKELTDLLSCDGDAVEFECHLTGNPEPNVRWFHYQELIRDCPDFETSFEDGAARLKIKQVTAEDEGTYTCEAANNLGKATSSACLVVYPPGEPNTLSQRLRRPPAFLSAASTPRSTPRSTPARSVSRTPGPETRRLCSPARTLAPSFYTYPFNKVAEEGDTVTLQCAIKGNPAPWATWDKDGVIITPSSRITIKEKDDVLRVLEIEQVTVDDVGVYRITIENEFGRQEASARIEVITQKGKFYAGVRAVSPSPRKSLTYRNRRPSTPRQD